MYRVTAEARYFRTDCCVQIPAICRREFTAWLGELAV